MKYWSRHFSTEDIQAMKRYLALLAFRETKIKSTMKCYFTSTGIVTIKIKDKNKALMRLWRNCWWEYKTIRPL